MGCAFALWVPERACLAAGLTPVLSVPRASTGWVIFLQFVLHGGTKYLVGNGEKVLEDAKRFSLTQVQLY